MITVMTTKIRCQLRHRPSLPCVKLTVEQCQFIVFDPHIFGPPGHACLKSSIQNFFQILWGEGAGGAHRKGLGTLKSADIHTDLLTMLIKKATRNTFSKGD